MLQKGSRCGNRRGLGLRTKFRTWDRQALRSFDAEPWSSHLDMVHDLRDASDVADGFLSDLFVEEARQAAAKEKESFSVPLAGHPANAEVWDLPQAILGGAGDGADMGAPVTFRLQR
jgi:hypothetical protein